MNKKILYGIILISLFLISCVSMVAQPVAGAKWKFGVPDEAKGITTEREVKIYDKDTWGDCLGYCREYTANEKFGGVGTHANDVGAKSRSDIKDWERTDIWMHGHVLDGIVPPECDGTQKEISGYPLTDQWSVIDAAYGLFNGWGQYGGTRIPGATPEFAAYMDPGNAAHGKIGVLESIVAVGMSGFGADPNWLYADGAYGSNYSIYKAMTDCTDLFQDSTLQVSEIPAVFPKTYKGTELERDLWDFTFDYDSDPDYEEDIVPFVENPYNLYDTYVYYVNFLDYQFNLGNNMIQALIDFNTTYNDALDPRTWGYINATMGNVLLGGLVAKYGAVQGAGTWTSLGLIGLHANTVDTYIDALLAPDGDHPLQGGVAGLLALEAGLRDSAPMQKKEFLASILQNGIPAHQPVDKWLEKLVDGYNIQEDQWWGDNTQTGSQFKLVYPTMTGATKIVQGVPVVDELHQGGIEVDGQVVTVKYEWAPGTLNDPADPDSERDDYKIEYTYSDTGSQSSVVYLKGDKIFYKIESLSPAIPGYEITVLLGAAALSALALIYVVMKKKRI